MSSTTTPTRSEHVAPLTIEESRNWYLRRIREAIEGAPGATIRTAARAIGVAPDTLSRRLNGRSGKAFNFDELFALGDHLGVDWLSFFSDEMSARDVPKVVDLTSGHDAS
ncbi:helix-turn-helix transcriptional regulator [Cellulosimicrobium funkei]|uniref:helix-turn-helix domain-containing protein n=1 Tax=Cellulosimicrobium funkei TaxID=264251 RepID=UPI000397509E